MVNFCLQLRFFLTFSHPTVKLPKKEEAIKQNTSKNSGKRAELREATSGGIDAEHIKLRLEINVEILLQVLMMQEGLARILLIGRRYRLRLEVSGDTTTLVVTLFDEVAQGIMKKNVADLRAEMEISGFGGSSSETKWAYPIGRESVNSFQTSNYEMKVHVHAELEHNLDLNLGMSVSADVPRGKDNVGEAIPICLSTMEGGYWITSGQLNLNSADHQCNNSNDTSLTELLFMVRRHLKLGGQLHNNSEPIAFLNSKDPTLTELLHMGREQDKQNKESITFACKVLIKTIRPQTTWCYLACDGCKSNEGISDVGGPGVEFVLQFAKFQQSDIV